MRKVFVGFIYSHHRYSRGGYHHIMDYLPYDQIILAQWEFDFLRPLKKNLLNRILKKLYLLILGEGTPVTVIRCIFQALFRRNLVFHFIYAENTYKWLHHFTGKRNKIVCTFHQPPEFFSQNPQWIKTLRYIDKIIVMTNKSVELFESLTGKKNVFFIPHGVDTDFYYFNPMVNKDLSILMVGNWLRDFQLAKSVFVALKNEIPELKIRIVTLSAHHHYFIDIQCELYEGISDEQLRDFYQKSNVVFFPLIEYTANNAMLEAAACGCQILVATNSAFDASYFGTEWINFCSASVDEALNSCINLLKNDPLKIGQGISAYVNRSFSWKNVALMTQKVLETE